MCASNERALASRRVIGFALVPLTSLAAGGANAAEPAASVVRPVDVLNTGVSLLVIIGVIMALAWAWSRLQGGRARNGGFIRVLAAQPLGAKERLMLVDVGGRQLVLGVTATRINTLHVLDEPVAAGESACESTGFSARLRTVVRAAREATS